MERFEILHPGTTNRYLSLAEQQSTHRQRQERTALHYHGVTQVLGAVFAGLALLGGIAGGVWLIGLGKSLEGLAAVIGAIATAVGVYRWGQSAQASGKNAKAKAEQR